MKPDTIGGTDKNHLRVLVRKSRLLGRKPPQRLGPRRILQRNDLQTLGAPNIPAPSLASGEPLSVFEPDRGVRWLHRVPYDGQELSVQGLEVNLVS